MYIQTEVDIDIDDILNQMTPQDEERLLKKMAANVPISDEQTLWCQARIAASSGRTDQLLSILETIAWDHHDVFIDTHRCMSGVAA